MFSFLIYEFLHVSQAHPLCDTKMCGKNLINFFTEKVEIATTRIKKICVRNLFHVDNNIAFVKGMEMEDSNSRPKNIEWDIINLFQFM